MRIFYSYSTSYKGFIVNESTASSGSVNNVYHKNKPQQLLSVTEGRVLCYHSTLIVFLSRGNEWENLNRLFLMKRYQKYRNSTRFKHYMWKANSINNGLISTFLIAVAIIGFIAIDLKLSRHGNFPNFPEMCRCRQIQIIECLLYQVFFHT